ncbi:MAG: hypothetical protein RMK57_17285, partial [Bryobacterales bacterium]|nr:hypothetical protein [Bryobacterales bacterium]
RRRDRYETAYIERNLRGYYPVEVHRGSNPDSPVFSLVVEEKDGQKYRRVYGFRGYRIRLIGKEPWTAPSSPSQVTPTQKPIETSGSTWQERLRELGRKFRGAVRR